MTTFNRKRSKDAQVWRPDRRRAGEALQESARQRSAMWLPPEPDLAAGPAQRPIEELAGVHITGEMIKEMPPDPFKRSKFSNEACYRAWCELEEEHQAHRGAPRPIYDDIWFSPGFLALMGIMGSGKTAIATVWARRWYRRGWTVQTTAGPMFGQRWGPEEFYQFGRNAEPGSLTFMDEVHTGFHAASSHALREESFRDDSTGMRKGLNAFIGATARKKLPPTFREVVDWAGWPRRACFERLAAFPPACLNVYWLGPNPFEGQDRLEELGYVSADQTRLHREEYDPFEVEECFKLFDSFERIQALFGDALNASRFRASLSEGKPDPLSDQEIATAILNWYADGQFQTQEAACREFEAQGIDLMRDTRRRRHCMVGFDQVAALLLAGGGPKVGPRVLRRALAGVGVDSGTAGVLVSELEAAYQRLVSGPFD